MCLFFTKVIFTYSITDASLHHVFFFTKVIFSYSISDVFLHHVFFLSISSLCFFFRFLPERVKPIIYELLSKHLTDMEYEPIQCSTVAKLIAQEIKMRVKEMNFQRFKVRGEKNTFRVLRTGFGVAF